MLLRNHIEVLQWKLNHKRQNIGKHLPFRSLFSSVEQLPISRSLYTLYSVFQVSGQSAWSANKLGIEQFRFLEKLFLQLQTTRRDSRPGLIFQNGAQLFLNHPSFSGYECCCCSDVSHFGCVMGYGGRWRWRRGSPHRGQRRKKNKKERWK